MHRVSRHRQARMGHKWDGNTCVEVQDLRGKRKSSLRLKKEITDCAKKVKMRCMLESDMLALVDRRHFLAS